MTLSVSRRALVCGLSLIPIAMLRYATRAAESSVRYALVPGKSIDVDLGRPHPFRGLLVYTPSGRTIYLIGDYVKYALMSAASFPSIGRLVIDADLVGTELLDGIPTRKKVFAEPGGYQFYLADNIETEPDNATSTSFWVQYSGAPPNTALERSRDR